MYFYRQRCMPCIKMGNLTMTRQALERCDLASMKITRLLLFEQAALSAIATKPAQLSKYRNVGLNIQGLMMGTIFLWALQKWRRLK